ncbi:MAG: FHIPEP family type III secretion protein, partial [Deltaproteobacteria bacterium]|nr:FHIPEP family type III secretion protein [Deltaproteobacteria bacterium]
MVPSRGRDLAFVRLLVCGGGMLLPVAAVACLALIVVPLPSWVIDLLLTFSLGLALWLLSLALGAPSRESLGFLPNALVLFTLFRLSLNLGTTRLVLTEGYAGRVIDSFGSFMVGGSYLVGGVVFAIITIVQLVVIARGTSRVAEVTARFSLDGLPGRQRGIDSELAARVIDAAEARRRRTQMERESFLHGGLDGAMRFIQGDALAGLLITMVNLLGGLAVGVLRMGLSLEQALQRFGLLTIGDGLATQIPALLTATATGLVVTRVAGADPDAPPGEELSRQLLSRPSLLALVGGILALLALVPQLPALPFLAVAGGLGLVAVLGARFRPEPAPQVLDPPLPPRLVLGLGAALANAAAGPGLEAAARGELEELSRRLGVPVPLPVVRRLPATAPPEAWQVLLDGCPLGAGTEDHAAAELPDRLARSLAELLVPAAGELCGVAETRRLLDRLGAVAPDLVRSVVPERLDVPTLAAVLRGLLRGGVPVVDLRGVLEVLATVPPAERDPTVLIDRVRSARRRLISHLLAGDDGRLGVYLVDPLVEDALGAASRASRVEGTIRIDRALQSDLRQALQRCPPRCKAAPGGNGHDREVGSALDTRPVLLASPESRRHLEAALCGRALVISS